MKKITFLVIIMASCILWSKNAYAQEILQETTQEYTLLEGEQEVLVTDYYAYSSSSIFLKRKMTYLGFVVPDRTITGYVVDKGIVYSGTLYLVNYTYFNNQTIALYEGTLYPTS